MKKFRVWLRSVPGPIAQYDGYVDVVIEEGGNPFAAAIDKLRRGTFPERGPGMWRLTKIEEVG